MFLAAVRFFQLCRLRYVRYGIDADHARNGDDAQSCCCHGMVFFPVGNNGTAGIDKISFQQSRIYRFNTLQYSISVFHAVSLCKFRNKRSRIRQHHSSQPRNIFNCPRNNSAPIRIGKKRTPCPRQSMDKTAYNGGHDAVCHYIVHSFCYKCRWITLKKTSLPAKYILTGNRNNIFYTLYFRIITGYSPQFHRDAAITA